MGIMCILQGVKNSSLNFVAVFGGGIDVAKKKKKKEHNSPKQSYKTDSRYLNPQHVHEQPYEHPPSQPSTV